MFEKIKRFFDLGLWTADMVKAAAQRGIITKAQEKDILS